MKQRRLPHSVQTKKSQRHFSSIVMFIFLVMTVMVLGGYYFLYPQSPVEKIIEPTVVEEPQEIPSLGDEGNEESIMDDIFSDAEVVQLYKMLENPGHTFPYWQWPLKQCVWSGPAVSIVVDGTKTVSPFDLETLEKLDVPLTLAVDEKTYETVHAWAAVHGHSIFLALPPLDPALSSKELGDYLDKMLQGKSHVMGVMGAFPNNPEFAEALILHVKHRGLVFLDTAEHGMGSEISQKVLALYLKVGPEILVQALHKNPLKKLGAWIKKQKKKKVSFVLATGLLCRHVA
jgi:hypothetical protein